MCLFIETYFKNCKRQVKCRLNFLYTICTYKTKLNYILYLSLSNNRNKITTRFTWIDWLHPVMWPFDFWQVPKEPKMTMTQWQSCQDSSVVCECSPLSLLSKYYVAFARCIVKLSLSVLLWAFSIDKQYHPFLETRTLPPPRGLPPQMLTFQDRFKSF